MPDYKITVYLKGGTYKYGIRSHPSNNPDEVRKLVGQIVRKTFEPGTVDWIDVMPTALGRGKEVKPLVSIDNQ